MDDSSAWAEFRKGRGESVEQEREEHMLEPEEKQHVCRRASSPLFLEGQVSVGMGDVFRR